MIISEMNFLHNGAEEHEPVGTVEKNWDCNK